MRFEPQLNVRARAYIVISLQRECALKLGQCQDQNPRPQCKSGVEFKLSNCRLRARHVPEKPLRCRISRATLEPVGEKKDKKGKKRPSWIWPLGLLGTGVAGAAVVVLRGCWHRKMSWPIRIQGYSYQVCLGCGIKRLFDETTFRGYGPYSYDLDKLIARERALRMKSSRDAARSAS